MLQEKAHTCAFHITGFNFQGKHYRACGTRYHAGCVRGGTPFTSHLFTNTRGLEYPSQLTSFPFSCEGCTVRVFLKRELFACLTDIHLLKLKRMGMIDMANAWSHGTLSGIMYSLRRLTTFSEKYGVPTLLGTPLIHPPASPVIPILWTVSDYTLQQPKRTKNNVTYNSARALQSAAAAFNSWTLALSNPDTMYRSPYNRILGATHFSPTDSLVATLTNAGMRRRLGTDTGPSVALTLKHILFNQESRAQQVTGNPDSVAAWQYASENSADIFAWCGWNRAEQNVQLQTEDVTFFLPEHEEQFALPPWGGSTFPALSA
jgi:hypothetical protein